MLSWIALTTILRLTRESYVRPPAPEVQAWGRWLLEHTTIEEAKTWRPALAKINVPFLESCQVLVSPDGMRGYTFSGVLVDVVSTSPITSETRANFGRGQNWSPGARGVGAAAIYSALGRTEDLKRCYANDKPLLGTESQALTSTISAHAQTRANLAVVAFQTGDDEVALRIAISLNSDLPSISRRLAANPPHGFDTPISPEIRLERGLPTLIADLKRRVAHPKPSRDRNELAQEGTIAELIDALEDSRVSRIYNSDSSAILYYDPAIAALVAKGEAAVPALLVASESDTRLTRGPQDQLALDREGLTVAELATGILRQIGSVTYFPGEMVGDRTESSVVDRGAFRRFFEATRGMTRSERAFWILTRPYLPMEREHEVLVQAANVLLSPPPTDAYPVSPSQTQPIDLLFPVRSKDPKRVILADALPATDRQRLIAVLSARADEMSVSAAQWRSTGDLYVMDAALRLASIRAVLAPEGADGMLRIVTRRAQTIAASGLKQYDEKTRFGIGLAYALRARLREAGVHKSYLAWLKSLQFSPGDPPDTQALTPLYDAHRDPGYAPVTDWLFNPDSPWSRRGFQTFVEWRRAPRGIPYLPIVVRDRLLRTLDDRRVVAEATLDVQGSIVIKTRDGAIRSHGRPQNPPVRPVAEAWPLRACDLVADGLLWPLNTSSTAPKPRLSFSLADTELKRDADIARIRAVLKEQTALLPPPTDLPFP